MTAWPATDIDGVAVSDAIDSVKYALTVAQLRAGTAGLPYKLGSIDVELKLVRTLDATGKPVFKVPVLDWEIGGQMQITREQTQVLSISLAPPEPQLGARPDDVPIDIPIADGLVELTQIIRGAASGDPGLVLGKDGASVALQFAFTADGKITLLIFEGHAARATTSTLTVKVVPA
jgi:NTP-dependent ternary system trypsin peptidase co-occuring protein